MEDNMFNKKKKKAEEQARLEAIAQAEAQAEAQKKAARVPTASFKVMNNCGVVPVARPADFIQLTPVVQPIPLVPYSTQMQPLAQFDEDDE